MGLWSQCATQWGAGPGFKVRVARTIRDWFEKLQGVLDTLRQDGDLILAQKTIQQVEVSADGWRRAFSCYQAARNRPEGSD